MKKQVQFLAVLSTAAVMTAVAPGAFQAIPGFAQNVYAASKAGWTEEDGELRYLDSDGYPITDAWKKKDNDWYYLNDDGVIARSQMVDEYYVDEDGKRIYNQWISEENDDWDEDAAENNWYYFGMTANLPFLNGRPLTARITILMRTATCSPESWNWMASLITWVMTAP